MIIMDEHDSLQDSLAFILYRTALALKAALQRFFRENDCEITAEQWGILRHLWEEEGISQREIGEKTAKDTPNITRLLDAMERKRIIFRQPDPRDRRKYCIYLTKEGKQLHARLLPKVLTLREQVMVDLQPQEIALVKATLNKIYHNIGNL